MLDDYRPIFINGVHLVALYAVAYISAPLTPANILEYIVLAAASKGKASSFVYVLCGYCLDSLGFLR